MLAHDRSVAKTIFDTKFDYWSACVELCFWSGREAFWVLTLSGFFSFGERASQIAWAR